MSEVLCRAAPQSEQDSAFVHLKEVTDQLLRRDAGFSDLVKASAGLRDLFSAISGISANSEEPENLTETHLPAGKAISPQDAVRCLTDFQRTAQFLRGVEAAIRAARQRFPGCCVEVLYAGCGPFAPLAIPLMTRFPPDQVRFTLLDIHPRSLQAVEKILARFGFARFVRAVIQCDAASYRQPKDIPVHVAVAETMQKALAKEPQVAISANLARQLCAGGLLIPQRIVVRACLADLGKEMTFLPPDFTGTPDEAAALGGRVRLDLGQLLEVTAETVRDLLPADTPAGSSEVPHLPPVVVAVPALPAGGPRSLMLLTRIQVLDSICLGDYDSGISYPTVLADVNSLGGAGRLEFRYRLGPQPGFTYRVV
jgi:hypothetical protein